MVAVDGAGQKPCERGGFVVRYVKVLHDPDDTGLPRLRRQASSRVNGGGVPSVL
jgi:hypothetical protein